MTGILLLLCAAQADPDHWAFKDPVDAPVPRVRDAGFVRTPVDAFILARLEAAGLSPSPQADRRTLIRRVSFTLRGFPPTMEEVAAFRADRRPGAYERVVDRMLASPAYGERWGRHWLDVARYSDTKGYVFREERRFPHAHTYRDWVIGALNADMPYDRFMRLQVAADLLDPEDPRDLAAMGFITVGRRFLNREPDIMDDRIDVVTRGLLGLTVNCARCHDHKYDPIPTEDYYSLYGIFVNSPESRKPPVIGEATDPEAKKAYERERAKLQAAVDRYRDEKLAKRLPGLKKTDSLIRYLRATYEGRREMSDALLRKLADKHKVNRTLLAHWLKYQGGEDDLFAAWRAFASIPPREFKKQAASVARSLEKGHPKIAEAFRTAPASMDEVIARYAGLFSGPLQDRLKSSGGPFEVDARDIERLLPRNERDHLRKLQRKVDALAVTHAGSPPRAMVLEERPEPREQHVFVRGNQGSWGKKVQRQFLSILEGPGRKPFTQGTGRKELAEAIASPRNPLTARVIVNRIWRHHFGAGLVTTPSDFGVRSDLPSHPELLDWMSLRLVEDGWSLKSIHRLILCSATFRQASPHNEAASLEDPGNRLLWRMNRRRLEWEPLRDAVLAVSGELDRRMGGRSVEILQYPSPPRRSVYGYVERQNLPGTLRTFDFASPDIHVPKRHETTVPQQALFMMNSPFMTAQARALADRAGTGSRKEQVANLFRHAFQRAPSAEETAWSLAFLARGPGEPRDRVVASAAWSYGYGEVDDTTGRLRAFHRLPHFTGEGWQGGRKLPDPRLGWVLLTAQGGHAGNDLKHAAVRRWTADSDGAVAIEGTVLHAVPHGDGVRARILSSRAGELASWVVHNGSAETILENVEVRKGDVIDFVIDRRASISHDSFAWSPIVRQQLAAGGTATWSAARDFRGPAGGTGAPMKPLERLAQALLMTNEFYFVD